MDTETEFKLLATKLKETVERFDSDKLRLGNRLSEVEQKMARRGGGGDAGPPRTLGHALIASPEFKSLSSSIEANGRAKITIKRPDALSEYKAILSGSLASPGTGAPLISPMYYDLASPVMLARQTLPVRALLMPGNTSSNMIYFPRQTVRLNNAAPVPEGAQKPLSDMTFENVATPVRTIAHLMRMSKQVLDDAPALQSIVEGEMRFGLSQVEGYGRDLLLRDVVR